MYVDTSLQHFLDDLASSNATPGGGSASALSGALGAALASMVARLTLGNARYIDVQPEIEQLLQETEKLRERFQQVLKRAPDRRLMCHLLFMIRRQLSIIGVKSLFMCRS